MDAYGATRSENNRTTPGRGYPIFRYAKSRLTRIPLAAPAKRVHELLLTNASPAALKKKSAMRSPRSLPASYSSCPGDLTPAHWVCGGASVASRARTSVRGLRFNVPRVGVWALLVHHAASIKSSLQHASGIPTTSL